MICSAKRLITFSVIASGRVVGKIEDVVFDDHVWIERYLVASTGHFINKKRILVSPISIKDIDWDKGEVLLRLSQYDFEESPTIDSDPTVSYQDEMNHYRYYKWPYYWTGTGTFGIEGFPGPAEIPPAFQPHIRPDEKEEVNTHLRSTREVCKYRVHATNEIFGRVEDFLFNDEDWKVEAVLINPKNWWHSKPIRLSPQDITRFSWQDEEVVIAVPKEKVLGAPYSESRFSH